MKDMTCYEDYPTWIVMLSNAVSFAIYSSGSFVIYKIGWIWLVLYLLYIAWLEIRVMKRSCVNCHYFGRICAFGKSKLASLLFKKGDTSGFEKDKVTWKDVIPDFLVSLIPIVVCVIMLVVDFDWTLLSLVIFLLLLTSIGNGLIRGSLACKYCKQREIGCPAEQLFSRGKMKAEN